MKSDNDIQHNVETGLRRNPEIDGTDIAAKVNDAVVALGRVSPTSRTNLPSEPDALNQRTSR
jgi:osmotically-inducible protein OsmY